MRQHGGATSIVKSVDGGGVRFVTIQRGEDATFHLLREHSLKIFFPDGCNMFGESKEDVFASILSATRQPIPLTEKVTNIMFKVFYLAGRSIRKCPTH